VDDAPAGGFGVAPDGTPWPVHAPVAYDYGAGAIVGLAHGRARGADARVVALAGVIAESLMRRGMWRPEQVLPRVEAAALGPEALPALALPVALFFAGDAATRRAVVLALGRAIGASDVALLGALAVASAIATGAHDMGHAEAMGVAAVLTIDAESTAMPEAHAQVRAELARAVAAPDLAALDRPDAASALTRAIFHLLHDAHDARLASDPRAPIDVALAGMLVGAARGLDAWPDAGRSLADPALASLVALLPPAPSGGLGP